MKTKARARKTDPKTSHEAAASIKLGDMSETQRAIVALLTLKDMTDDELYLRFFQGAETGNWKHASQPGVRSRRAELVTKGVVRGKGYAKTKFGRNCTVWGL